MGQRLAKFSSVFPLLTVTSSRQEMESCEGTRLNPFSKAGKLTVLLCLATRRKALSNSGYLCSAPVGGRSLKREVVCCVMSQKRSCLDFNVFTVKNNVMAR